MNVAIYYEESKQEHEAESPGIRPPGQTVSIIRRKESEIMNFNRWILCILCIISILLTPSIFYMSIQARTYGLSKIAFDKALITIGLLLFIINTVTIYASIRLRKNLLLSIVYSYVVLLVFLIIYTIAIFSFSPDVQGYFYENWDSIRDHVASLNYEHFKSSLRDQIIALGIFNICIMICIVLSLVAIVFLVSVEKIIRHLLPPLNLILVVLSASLVMTGIYSWSNSLYLQIPGWIDSITISGGFFMLFSGIFGYYATLTNQKRFLKVYIGILGIILFFVLLTAVGYFMFSSIVGRLIDDNWPEIYQKLLSNGHDITKRNFHDYMILVIKFAGLYGLVIAIFLVMTITAALIKIFHPDL